MKHNFGEMLSYEVTGNEIKVQFENQMAYFTVVRDEIIRVYVPFFDETCKSKAIENEVIVPTNFEVEKAEDVLCISTDKVLVKIQDDFVVESSNRYTA